MNEMEKKLTVMEMILRELIAPCVSELEEWAGEPSRILH